MGLCAWELPCEIQPGTVLERAYQRRSVGERHRHRYEFNNSYRQQLEEAGLVISGTSPDGRLVEAVELPGHDFYVGVQYHPEFNPVPIGSAAVPGVYRRGAEKAGENIGKELKPVYIDYRENQKISMRF